MAEKRKKYIEKSNYKKQLRMVVSDILFNNVKKYKKVKIVGYDSFFRIRVGDLRIVYETTKNGNIIKYIGPRGDIYRNI